MQDSSSVRFEYPFTVLFSIVSDGHFLRRGIRENPLRIGIRPALSGMRGREGGKEVLTLRDEERGQVHFVLRRRLQRVRRQELQRLQVATGPRPDSQNSETAQALSIP